MVKSPERAMIAKKVLNTCPFFRRGEPELLHDHPMVFQMEKLSKSSLS